jgi:hypothetical protein
LIFHSLFSLMTSIDKCLDNLLIKVIFNQYFCIANKWRFYSSVRCHTFYCYHFECRRFIQQWSRWSTDLRWDYLFEVFRVLVVFWVYYVPLRRFRSHILNSVIWFWFLSKLLYYISLCFWLLIFKTFMVFLIKF